MNNKLFLTILLGLFIIGNVFALDSLGTGKQGTNFTIIQTCDDATYITLDGVLYPDKTYQELNVNMTSSASGTYLYNFTNTSQSGRYDISGTSDGCEGTFTYYFEVTPTGIENTESRTTAIGRAVWFLFGIALILLIAFLFINSKPPIKWTFFIISIMFFLQAVTILFTGLQDEVVNPKIENYFSFFASASFILFWFAFGILAILWILTTLQTILFKRQQKKEEKYG